MNRQAVDAYEKALGPKHPSTLRSTNNLASTYRNQGRWKEAEELEVQVMGTSLRVLGQEHPDTLISMANLATMWRCQERSNEAEELKVECVELRKRMLGLEHPDTQSSIANLATQSSLNILNKWETERSFSHDGVFDLDTCRREMALIFKEEGEKSYLYFRLIQN